MKYRNLVFEGGGVKGIAYVGALEHLTSTPLKEGDKPIDLKEIKRVAGTSAGAIAALLVSLNYSVAEIRKKFEEIDFRDFADKVNIFEWAYSRFIKGEHYLY
ncbi:MAG: patatin-like phospholipase family protein, partial [Gammaproteobacteria bacterium]